MTSYSNSDPSYYLKWNIDTGVTDHIISNYNHLDARKVVKNAGKVQLPTGESAKITYWKSPAQWE